MPGTVNTAVLDPLCGPQIRLHPARGDVRRVLSNSFGFGGTNCVLVFGRGDAAASGRAAP
jgi:3-oxoacyl-[acyl-carrier-protein] synthase-1